MNISESPIDRQQELYCGPYLPIYIDRSTEDSFDSYAWYCGSLDEALKIDNLEITDLAIQSLYQMFRHRLSSNSSAALHRDCIDEEMKKTVNLSKHPNFESWFNRMTNKEIENEITASHEDD